MKNNGLDITFISLIAVLFLTYCEKEKPEPPDLNTKITISNATPSQISYRTASLKATLGDTYGHTDPSRFFGHAKSRVSEPTLNSEQYKPCTLRLMIT